MKIDWLYGTVWEETWNKVQHGPHLHISSAVLPVPAMRVEDISAAGFLGL